MIDTTSAVSANKNNDLLSKINLARTTLANAPELHGIVQAAPLPLPATTSDDSDFLTTSSIPPFDEKQCRAILKTSGFYGPVGFNIFGIDIFSSPAKRAKVSQVKMDQLVGMASRAVASGQVSKDFKVVVSLAEDHPAMQDFGMLPITSPPEIVWALFQACADILSTSPESEDIAKMRRALLALPVTFQSKKTGLLVSQIMFTLQLLIELVL